MGDNIEKLHNICMKSAWLLAFYKTNEMKSMMHEGTAPIKDIQRRQIFDNRRRLPFLTVSPR